MKHQLLIWTDGSCIGNPGPGGWAGLLKYITIDNDGEITEHAEKAICGSVHETTNNRMEIVALIESLSVLKNTRQDIEVIIYTDSQYVVTSIPKLNDWRLTGWVKKDGKPASNPDLWAMVLPLVNKFKPTFEWVRGHSKNANNARVDGIAQAEARRVK